MPLVEHRLEYVGVRTDPTDLGVAGDIRCAACPDWSWSIRQATNRPHDFANNWATHLRIVGSVKRSLYGTGVEATEQLSHDAPRDEQRFRLWIDLLKIFYQRDRNNAASAIVDADLAFRTWERLTR